MDADVARVTDSWASLGFDPSVARTLSAIDRFLELEFAEHQGILSRGELTLAGLSDAAIQDRLLTGALTSRFPGVFRHPAVPPTRLGQLLEIQTWAGEESFFSHRTGAEILKLDAAPAGHNEICTPTGMSAPADVTIHRVDPDDRPATRKIEGLRVACPERVLFDLGTHVPYRVLGQCLDDALRKRMTTLPRLNDLLTRHGGRGRRGTKALRLMVSLRDDRDGLAASRMETLMLRILRRIKNHRFEAQYRVQDGKHHYYLDAAFPEMKLGIECHSVRWHMGEESLKRDARRDRRLSLLGWTILYFTWDDITVNPREVEFEIREALLAGKTHFLSQDPGLKSGF